MDVEPQSDALRVRVVRRRDGALLGQWLRPGEELSFGRAAGRDARFGALHISKKHGKVKVLSTGLVVVEDGSRNGTVVNGVLFKMASVVIKSYGIVTFTASHDQSNDAIFVIVFPAPLSAAVHLIRFKGYLVDVDASGEVAATNVYRNVFKASVVSDEMSDQNETQPYFDDDSDDGSAPGSVATGSVPSDDDEPGTTMWTWGDEPSDDDDGDADGEGDGDSTEPSEEEDDGGGDGDGDGDGEEPAADEEPSTEDEMEED